MAVWLAFTGCSSVCVVRASIFRPCAGVVLGCGVGLVLRLLLVFLGWRFVWLGQCVFLMSGADRSAMFNICRSKGACQEPAPPSITNTWLNIRALEHCLNVTYKKVRVTTDWSNGEFYTASSTNQPTGWGCMLLVVLWLFFFVGTEVGGSPGWGTRVPNVQSECVCVCVLCVCVCALCVCVGRLKRRKTCIVSYHIAGGQSSLMLLCPTKLCIKEGSQG